MPNTVKWGRYVAALPADTKGRFRVYHGSTDLTHAMTALDSHGYATFEAALAGWRLADPHQAAELVAIHCGEGSTIPIVAHARADWFTP